MIDSMDSVVVSVRIKKGTKLMLEKEGIDVEKSVKDFLTNRALQIELKRRIKSLTAIIEKNVKPSKAGFAVKSIREDRYVTH